MDKNKALYCDRQWLNPDDCRATGSIVCYDGITEFAEGTDRDMFVEVADCHDKARLHKAYDEEPVRFVNKVIKLRDCLNQFIEHLTSSIPEYSANTTENNTVNDNANDQWIIDAASEITNKFALRTDNITKSTIQDIIKWHRYLHTK